MDAMLERETFVVDTTLEIRIKDFSTATGEIRVSRTEFKEPYELKFFASIFPVGIDEDTEGWIVIRSGVEVYKTEKILESFNLNLLASIIDIEGNSRIPRHFTSDEDNRNAIYLEKSSILNKADELLSEGVLFLRCDINFTCDLMKTVRFDVREYIGWCFQSIPKAVCFSDGAESRSPSGTFTVFDHSSLVLSLAKDHGVRKHYGVYGIAPEKERTPEKSNLREIGILKYIIEHVWIFDTCPDRFLLNLDPHPDNVGHLLVNASTFIERCVNTSMTEQLEKRIELPTVDSLTFRIVLFFVKHGKLPLHIYDEIFEVYKFSHMYGMENLRQKCAEFIVERCMEGKAEFELEKKAEFFSDGYLLALLRSRQSGPVKDDRLNPDCYK